jgi:hypothetical protein
MRIKKPKINKVARNIVKTVSANPVKTKIKKSPIKNLGKYAHAAKLPTGAKIGKASVAKTTKRKVLNMRAQKGAHLNV